MNRRNFVSTSLAGGAAGLLAQELSAFAQGAQKTPQYFELKAYAPRIGSHRKRLSNYLKQAAIPAWNRHGISAVGVFDVVYGNNGPTQFVLLPHPSLESVSAMRGKLAADATYQADARDFLDASLHDPGFTRVESSLYKAFEGMPEIAVPERAGDNQSRIFELRIYESHSEPAAIRKIEMFNNGEIDIFLKTGLTPVFFGEALIGRHLPNLTYMLTFKDLEDRDASWRKFFDHPDWIAMKKDVYYKDTVSNITSIILKPAAFSQI